MCTFSQLSDGVYVYRSFKYNDHQCIRKMKVKIDNDFIMYSLVKVWYFEECRPHKDSSFNTDWGQLENLHIQQIDYKTIEVGGLILTKK